MTGNLCLQCHALVPATDFVPVIGLAAFVPSGHSFLPATVSGAEHIRDGKHCGPIRVVEFRLEGADRRQYRLVDTDDAR